MKIISISDVITNSSSEVFVFFNKDSEKRIKELVDVILGTFHVDKTFDDLFTIEYELSDNALEDNISVEQALTDSCDSNGMPYITSYKIVPKERGQYEYLCQLLSKLPDMFHYEVVYH